MTELQQFIAMLTRANIGHGQRIDHNPPGTGVQVEFEDTDCYIEFSFNADGKLVSTTFGD